MAKSSTKIAILGASSPFTAALFDALAQRGLDGREGGVAFALHGRNVGLLSALATYAAWRLPPAGVTVSAHTDLAAVLEGSDIVINQIRFGGLEARADEEALARVLGCVADETLGPCGLASALRQRPQILSLAQAVAKHCPRALVINLSNPLSLTTALFAQHGLEVIGVCELPLTTLRDVQSKAGLDPARGAWGYSGFNHRGFIFGLSQDGVDRMAEVATALAPQDPDLARSVAELDAVPLKYFRLFRGTVATEGRAHALMAIRDAVADELLRNPRAPPASLGRRNTDWYSDALAPMLAGLLGLETVELTINVLDDGLVRERRARIAGAGITLAPVDRAEGGFNAWLDRFEHHERLSMEALARPTRAAVGAALSADMITPPDRLDQATDAVVGMAG